MWGTLEFFVYLAAMILIPVILALTVGCLFTWYITKDFRL